MASKHRSILLCLVQCGETMWNADGRVHGATDLPLSDAGRSAVTAELNKLAAVRAAVVYHGPDEAAAETARICADPIGSKTKAIEELADPHLGLLEGLTEQEFAERFPKRFKQWDEDPLSLSPPEGEDVAAAADRLFKAVAKILRRSRSEEVVIVLHELGLGLLRCWLAQRPLNEVRPMLKDRLRVERYAVPIAILDSLENAASEAHAAS